MSIGVARKQGGEARAPVPPAVPGDDPPSTFAGLGRELAPRPGRAANMLRLTAIALIIVALCEALRIPNVATAAYMALILFKSDADATIPMAIMAGCAILFGILVSIVYFAATLSEPALRLPLMAVIAFGAMYLSRASALGPAAFVAGLFTVISLTKGDDLLSGDLSPYEDSDVERPGLPSLLYMPPEEALVHNLLWLALAIAVAVAVVLVVDRLTLPDPERKLRAALAERLSAMASFCAGDADARRRVADFARAGTAALSAQNALAGKLKGGRYRPVFGEGVIGATADLMLVLFAFGRLPARAAASDALRAAGPVLVTAATAVRDGTAMGDGPPTVATVRDDALASPLAAQLAQSLTALQRAIDDPEQWGAAELGGGFFKADAFSNLDYRRFAFKVTLAVMISYLFMNLSDWSSISTCITTCFVVALDGVGQSIHKMMLRVSGALAGAAIGFAALLFVMPALTDLGQLLCVMAPVILLGAWIRVGGERTSYFGQQFAFAFMLMVLQDYGPTLHFQTGRDRIIGILVGEIATAVVFLHVWPVSVGALVRAGTADALDHLAAALAPGVGQTGTGTVQAFADAIARTRGLLAEDRYEPDEIRPRFPSPCLDGEVLARVQSLAVPVSILLLFDREGGAEQAEACDAYQLGMAKWLRHLASWIRDGQGAVTLATSLPQPPSAVDEESAAPRAAWCKILAAETWEALNLMGVEGAAGCRSVSSQRE